MHFVIMNNVKHLSKTEIIFVESYESKEIEADAAAPASHKSLAVPMIAS